MIDYDNIRLPNAVVADVSIASFMPLSLSLYIYIYIYIYIHTIT